MKNSESSKNRTKRNIEDMEMRFFGSQVAYSVIALANLITQNTFRNTLAGSNLSVNEWRILRMTSIYESICAADVINLFGLDKTTTSRAITRLKEARLIKSMPSTQDRRQSNFALSSAGKRLHNKIIQQDNISDTSFEKVLSKAEIRTFHKTMKKLREHVKDKLAQSD